MEELRLLIGPDDGSAAAWQLCVRAVLLLIFGLVCIRIAGRRTFAQMAPLDIVVAIIVGSNLSRAMTGKAPFWSTLAATLVLVVLHRLLAWAGMRWSWLGDLAKEEPVVLYAHGRKRRRAMTRAGISDSDLEEALRMEQVDGLAGAKSVVLERGGKLSVVPKTAP